MLLQITSFEAKRNFSEIEIVLKKQISMNHARGKTELSFWSLWRKLY
jgi:hypothetical protein